MAALQSVLIAALSALKEPLFVLSGSREFVFANDSFRSFLRLRDADAISTTDFWHKAHEYRTFQDEMTVEFTQAEGETFLVKLNVQPLKCEGDCFLFRVVSALSKSDPGLTFHAQRLETLGILSGAVAHDFNNILTGILGHTTYLKTILPQSGPHVESLKAIEHGTRKGSSITQQILNFSKIDSGNVAEHINLADVIEKTCLLLRRAVPSRIALTTRLPDSEVQVIGSESQIVQVIVNLVINARDAIEESGDIAIELGVETDRELLSGIFSGLDLSASSYALITVTDSGHGIAENLLPKIFEPYFSTKKDKGTGLGLATVASIVRALGGAVTVRSHVGEGTAISLYLPSISQVQEAEPTNGATATKLFRGTERILVVDDESPVRNVLMVSLQHLGYSVEAAASGAEALSLVSKDPSAFDLVISDMLMPSMSGEELFFNLRQMRPDIRVLIISGYTSEESVRNVLSHGAVGFVPKPFTIEELSKQVRIGLESE